MAQGKAKTEKLELLRRERISQSMTGKTKTEEHVKKIVESRRSYDGESNPNYKGVRKNHICENCGITFLGHYGNPEINTGLNRFCGRKCKFEKQQEIKGESHPLYKHGKYTHDNLDYKYGTKYRRWRKAVLERDNFTCTECGTTEGELHTHHIIPYKDAKHLKYELDNGTTLCKNCHYTKTFRKSSLINGKACSRWAMVTRGKLSKDIAAAETK